MALQSGVSGMFADLLSLGDMTVSLWSRFPLR